jgi:hypothetical protein
MNKREILRQHTQEQTLQALGFTTTEAQALRRISITLSRWAENECEGLIERDENRNNRPFWSQPSTGRHFVAPVADREAGAMKRLQAIFARHSLTYYVQGDPRGVALYVIRPGDVPAGSDVESCYSRGVAIY